MFFDFFLKNLLDDFVVLHVFGKLHADGFTLRAALCRRDVEEIIARGFFDEVVIIRTFPRTC